jgi:outer membrane receptor protein involved in Fe transport
MRSLFAVLLCASFSVPCFAQQSELNGSVTDTLEKKKLSNAVVMILRQKDSFLYKSTRTDANGVFRFKAMQPGRYNFLVTYPGFADFFDQVDIEPGQLNNVGSIPMSLKSRIMEAIIVRSAAAMRMKGDTTEFIADSFKVREGATVEELLKRLPGFQVNSKGEITAQGQRVGKVLVDGEEFFGDDPTMATQNISAKAVDKIQVFDTKTERQQLTGISTGTEGKTVNIKLKREAKKGGFGKMLVASDFNKNVDAKALYNQFVGSRKLSAYATKSDIYSGTLDLDEQQKLGIENNIEYDELSGYYYSFSTADEFSQNGLRGLPHSYSAGALYNNKWLNEKENLNTSYMYNRLATDNNSSNLTQNILAGLITYRNKYQQTHGLNERNVINGKYEWKIDSLATIKLVTAGTRKTANLNSDGYSEFLNADRSFTNNSKQVIENATIHQQNDNQLTYRQQFHKANRLLMATFRFGIMADQQDAFIQTHTQFYKNNVVDSIDIADQEKTMNGQSKTMGAKITYNEPIGLKWNVVFDYSYNKNNSWSHRLTFNRNVAGKYEDLDQQYSNNFDVNAGSHTTMAAMRYMDKKVRMSIASGVSDIKLNLFNPDINKSYSYNFLNVTPQASLAYMFKPQHTLTFDYRGSTRQPTIDQLQPIRENTDRLNIFIGNPNLKVSFNNSFTLGYSALPTVKQTMFWVTLGYNLPVNSIVFNNSIDVSRGKQTYMPVNVNGSSSYTFYANYNKRRGNKKLNYGANNRINGGTNINFVNGQLNATKFMNSTININLSYNDDKVNFGVSPQFGYSSSRSTLQNSYNTRYWNYGGYMYGGLELPAKFEISSSCNFNLRQHIAAFSGNPNQVIWNAEISRNVLKDNSGTIYLIANDLLQQKKGFNRNISSNFISEDRYSILGRYFLLKLEWTFNKMVQKK